MFDVDKLLKQAALYERMALYSDRQSFLQALAQESNEDVEEITMPTANIQSTKPIPTDVQNMLSHIITVEGIGLPLQIDGVLGPKTRQALDVFKNKFQIPGKFTDESIFNFIKTTYNRNVDKYGK